MMIRLFTLICLTLFLQVTIFATPLYNNKVKETLLVDHYFDNKLNLNQLLGYYITFDFGTPIDFVSGTSWALTGDYGGYGTASLGPSYKLNLTNKLRLTFSGMIGVGGHARLPLGDGLLTLLQVGITYYLTPTIGLDTHIGRLNYPNGDYDVSVFSIGISSSYHIFFNK